ncbi:MAG: DevR family CRISPR-associated autoregulator [Anaerolineae bacterium]|nr:DevR family CRISPR-associated autoregulator [Anaerolineae bacterium]
MATRQLYALAVSGLATLDLHSLNNEGGEGNQITTRMVNIVGEDGRMYNVNAISGDMFKHIHAEHLHRIAVTAGLPLSQGARLFNANRANYDLADDSVKNETANKTDAAMLDWLLERCAVTDMMGLLITAGNRSVPRKSVVEYGWTVGVPGSVETDSYFHVKYASERSKEARAASATDEARKANVGQAIFYRPASSGKYAMVAQVEAARIGFNDIAHVYAVNETGRGERYRALLESLMYTFVEPAGAMRSTQTPHIVDFQGAITLSYDVVPAPALSALNRDFANELERVATALNTLRPDAVEVRRFASMGEFAEIMTEIIRSTEPYTLRLTA